MAKGKKQKPKKRVARRVDEDEQLREGESAADGLDGEEDTDAQDGEGTNDGDDAEGQADADGKADEETSEAPPEPVREAPAAVAKPVRSSAAKSPKGKPADAPPEMPITQHSDKGGVIFLSVVFGLLGLAILVGFLTS